MVLRSRATRRQFTLWRLVGVLLGVVVICVGSWLIRGRAQSKEIEPSPLVEQAEPPVARVKMVRPRVGGIPRTIQQPATMHAFESVDLYAMISGYLKSQTVDIGSRVKRGEVLAEINVPRDTKARDETAALVLQAKARVRQTEARINMAQAQRAAAQAAIAVAEADLDRLVAKRIFADKQYARVSALVAEHVADAKLADEQTSDLAAAVAAERTGSAEILNARAKLLAAEAAVDQARADAAEARANVGVAEARLERATVNLAYARIVAPFDGVVTHRMFHLGALIRSATEGGTAAASDRQAHRQDAGRRPGP